MSTPSPIRGEPPAEVDADEQLVRRLLVDQAPHLAHLDMHDPRNGWDNRTWRLGDDLAVRLPRRAAGAQLLLHEQRWLPGIASRIDLPAPAPTVLGRPAAGFPWAWSVVPWFDGEVAALETPHPAEARVLGRALAGLHTQAPDEAPHNPFRGVALAERLPSLEQWRAVEHAPADSALVARAADLVVAAARDLPAHEQRVWLHGDLHPRNILVRQGHLAAILDWGDLCGGDPATDLATVWWLFDLEHHAAFWPAYAERQVHGDRHDPALWHRSRAWAAVFGLMFLNFATADDPTVADAAAADLGRAMLRRVLATQQPPAG
jgi:aminoglycoside phosphotransferase (APT) family kinase protein